MAHQRNSAGGRERPQRCWATRTTGVRDVSSTVKKCHPCEINASGGGLHVAPTNAPHLFAFKHDKFQTCDHKVLHVCVRVYWYVRRFVDHCCQSNLHLMSLLLIA